MRKLQLEVAKYEKTLEDVQIDRLLDASTIDSKAEIAKRKGGFKRFIDASNELRDFFVNMSAHYRKELDATPLSEKSKNDAVAGFKEGAQPKYATVIRIRDLDAAMGRAGIRLMEVLEKEWGQWSFDADTDLIDFESDSAVDAYNALLEKLNAAAEEQMQMQKRVVEAQ